MGNSWMMMSPGRKVRFAIVTKPRALQNTALSSAVSRDVFFNQSLDCAWSSNVISRAVQHPAPISRYAKLWFCVRGARAMPFKWSKLLELSYLDRSHDGLSQNDFRRVCALGQGGRYCRSNMTRSPSTDDGSSTEKSGAMA